MASTHPTRPRGAARRAALLDATLTLVGELGADAVTHRRVAERAGLPLASTTYWFDSKEQLLTEALAHAADQDTERLRAGAQRVLDGDGAPTPAVIVSVLAGTVADGGPAADRGALMATYALMLEAARRPALQGLSERWTEAYLQWIGALLQRAGSRRPVNDARLLVAACDGLIIDGLATGDAVRRDPRPELERLLTALLADAR